MPYKVTHPYMGREWVVKKDDGTYAWGPYEKAEEFQNWFKAKKAYDTMEPIRDCYNMVKEPIWMKVS